METSELGHRHRTSSAFLLRQEAVERAETYLRANRDMTVPISRLCRVVGLSERSLRNAFYSVHGMGPKRWMLIDRLEGVRRALSVARPPVTITDIAIDHGFSELGRFAGSYREAFGESPSETLRGSGRRSESETKGHAHA
jgi:AraC family ethanolamine operon transcriptional activator